MTDLENKLKENQKRINKLRARIKQDLQEVIDLVKESNLLIQTYKSISKSFLSRNLAKVWKSKVQEANEIVRSMKVIGRREKVDRILLEELQVIEKPNRKNPNRVRADKPQVLIMGELFGKLRHMNEKGMSKANRIIANNMIKQLQEELNED